MRKLAILLAIIMFSCTPTSVAFEVEKTQDMTLRELAAKCPKGSELRFVWNHQSRDVMTIQCEAK